MSNIHTIDLNAKLHQQLDLDPFRAGQSEGGRNALMGLMFGMSLASLLLMMIWIVLDFGIPLVQLPLMLVTFGLTVVTGFLYFLNPGRFLTYFLIGLVYFTFEATVRAGGGGGDLQSILKGLFTLALAMLGIFTGSKFVFKTWFSTLMFGYCLFAAASAAYSPMPLIGGVAGIALVGVAIIAAKVGSGNVTDVSDYWRVMYWASVLTVVLSFIVLAISPMMARDLADPTRYRFRGITGTANSLGPIVGLAVVIALLMMKQAKTRWAWRFHALMLVAFLAALVLTNSRSSILGLVTAVGLSLLLTGRMGVFGVLLSLIFGTLMATVMFYPGLQEETLRLAASLFSRTGSVHELTSFTGRQAIWDASWRLVGESPWIGYGMSSVSVVLTKGHSDEWGNTVSTAHNSLLESLLTVGWVGTLPLVLLVVLCLWQLSAFLIKGAYVHANDVEASQRQQLVLCGFRCLVMMLVQGFGEKAFAGHPGSPFLALGAVVATTIYVARFRSAEREQVAHIVRAY